MSAGWRPSLSSAQDDVVILIGETKGHLGQSIYLREIEGREEGGAPPVDLAAEKKNGDFVRGLIEVRPGGHGA